MLKHLLLASAIALLPAAAFAQASVVPVPNGGGFAQQVTTAPGAPLVTSSSPLSAAAAPCQGGTGSVISSVTTTATTVCAAATSRSFAGVMPNSGTAGTIEAYCTYDGTTPSSSHFNFVLNGAGYGWDTSGYAAVPIGALQCVSASGTVTVTATAIQSPAP